jgi:hypothetical protein
VAAAAAVAAPAPAGDQVATQAAPAPAPDQQAAPAAAAASQATTSATEAGHQLTLPFGIHVPEGALALSAAGLFVGAIMLFAFGRRRSY